MRTINPRWQLILTAVIALALGTLLTAQYVMDDAFITYRYSYHLGQMGAAVWNQADNLNPTMGYTSVLWMLLNTIPALLTDNRDALLWAARLYSGVALGAMVLAFVTAIARMTLSQRAKLLITVTIFLQAGYGFHLNSGMETLLFSAFVLLAIIQHDSRWGLVFGLLAVLTRPEGIIALALLGFYTLWQREWQRALVMGSISTAVIALVLLLIHSFYGQWLPNAFYFKQHVGIPSYALENTVFFLVTLASPYLALAAFVVIKRRENILFVLTAVVFVAYFLTVYPAMNVLSRYQWVALVLLTYASLPALEALIRYRRKWLLGLMGLWFGVSLAGNLVGAQYFAATTGHAMQQLITLGKQLHDYRQDDNWLIYHDAGAVCYFSDWNCFDTLGLNNYEVVTGQLTFTEILQDSRSALLVANVDELSPSRNWQPRVNYYADNGFNYVDNVTILAQGEQRQMGVAFFARDAMYAESLLAGIDLQPDTPPHFFYALYQQVRNFLWSRAAPSS